MGFKFKKEYLSGKHLSKTFSDFWNNHYLTLFSLFSLIVLLVGMYIWYLNLYKSDWSAERKKEYNNSQSRQVKLKEQEFKEIISGIDGKKRKYDEPVEQIKDIFVPYAGEEKSNEENGGTGANNINNSNNTPAVNKKTNNTSANNPVPTF